MYCGNHSFTSIIYDLRNQRADSLLKKLEEDKETSHVKGAQSKCWYRATGMWFQWSMCKHNCKDYIEQNKQYDAARIPSNNVTITSMSPYETKHYTIQYHNDRVSRPHSWWWCHCGRPGNHHQHRTIGGGCSLEQAHRAWPTWCGQSQHAHWTQHPGSHPSHQPLKKKGNTSTEAGVRFSFWATPIVHGLHALQDN